MKEKADSINVKKLQNEIREKLEAAKAVIFVSNNVCIFYL